MGTINQRPMGMLDEIIEDDGIGLLLLCLKGDKLRTFLERFSLEELERFWDAAGIGHLSKTAGVIFDVMEHKPSGAQVVKRITHQSTDKILSSIVGEPACFASTEGCSLSNDGDGGSTK